MVLKFGAEVFDDTAFFFFGALVVEGDEFFEELVVGEVQGPAVGFEDGGVGFVVELSEVGSHPPFNALKCDNAFKEGSSPLFVDFLLRVLDEVVYCLPFEL